MATAEELLQNAAEVCVIDEETRTINVPPGESLFGVTGDKDVERKYFQCPKIVGDNIDLSQHQIYIVYVFTSTQNSTVFPSVGINKYHCEDVKVSGDNITFSWKLSGNVLATPGFIAFKVMAAKNEGSNLKTKWNTAPAFGTVLITVPDGEEIAEEYPDIINQLFEEMEKVQEIATPEAMQGYVEAYMQEHPVTGGMTEEQEQQLNQNTQDVVDLKSALPDKLDSNQGAENKEKFMMVGDDGALVPVFIYVTPEMFGAVGDGETDDTDAIKSALEFTLPINGYILFSKKTYCISSTLNIANKKIVFNGCTLKRISNCTVINFSGSKDFVLSDVNISDNGASYGIMVVGNECENVRIKNVAIVSNSPHDNSGGIGNWATSLSGDRFHISELYINNYESGLWADGLHFAYITNSLINDFVIISGDDSIAITEHEEGGTIFKNTISENVRFVNGVLKSNTANAIRLGFDNSGGKGTDEITNIYHKDITFENISCESKYFIRNEYISSNGDAIPPSDENILFSNVSYIATQDIENFSFFHTSHVYSLKNWRFKNCIIDLARNVTSTTTVPFLLSTQEDYPESGDGNVIFELCDLDFGYITGMHNPGMNKLKFLDCDIKTNGAAIVTGAKGNVLFDGCDIENYSDEKINYVLTFGTPDKDVSFDFRSCTISKIFQATPPGGNSEHISLFIQGTRFLNSNGTLNFYNGKGHYNNVIKDTKKLTSSEHIFVFVPADGNIKFDLTGYAYFKLMPLISGKEAYDVIVRSSDGIYMGTTDQNSPANMLSNAGIKISVSEYVLTIENLENTYKNVLIDFYAQTN